MSSTEPTSFDDKEFQAAGKSDVPRPAPSFPQAVSAQGNSGNKTAARDQDPKHPARFEQPEPNEVGAPSAHDLAAENLLDVDSRTIPKELRGSAGKRLRILVQRDLGERAEVGLETYGQTLQPGNGRDTLIDVYQEDLDALAYAEALLYEAKDSDTEALVKAVVVAHRSAALTTRALLARRNGEIDFSRGDATAPAAGDTGSE